MHMHDHASLFTKRLLLSLIIVPLCAEGPLRLEVMPASSTALKVRWLPPVNHNRGPIVYDVWCTLVYDDDVQVSVARNQTFFGLSGTNVMLTSLLPHKVYVVRVTARNEAGSSHSSAMHARTFSASKGMAVSLITLVCILYIHTYPLAAILLASSTFASIM